MIQSNAEAPNCSFWSTVVLVMESIYMDASQTREFALKLRFTTPKARLKVSTVYPNRRLVILKSLLRHDFLLGESGSRSMYYSGFRTISLVFFFIGFLLDYVELKSVLYNVSEVLMMTKYKRTIEYVNMCS